MKTYVIKISLLIIAALAIANSYAQNIKESVQPLSKKSQKGYLHDVNIMEEGNINVLYKISRDKNKDELFYELYSFDKDLKFIESKSANEPKIESKPDREQTYM